ncbi:D-alanine--D-alanine ligase family protein [Phyllobacterium lublinensis]|uniref:D-alanine--D-alanine ligase family protein n=1 Tax=Phyllobacterium lublinensis TaxID=2875708 RepID=UPI001CC9D625|nr:D-alanine--D-alanine ligase family protein [Phyllobacterium sp. 2063]MBZ9655100.1 D-alanine--D-alanine ligase [Phyllobacterium sp. 2063]
MSRIRVAILFGGKSAEHDVSLMSARNVDRAIDREKYEVVLIAITREGKWLLIDGAFPQSVPEDGARVSLLPGGKGRTLVLPRSGPAYEIAPVDVLIPILHGQFGEDGSVQGFAEVADVAYVGCGIFGSAAAMDKHQAKCLFAQAGLPVARGRTISRQERPDAEAIAQELGLPLFVKPVRQGSSVGVSKARTAAELSSAIDDGLKYDSRVLIEEFIDAREIELGVLEEEDGTLRVSVPGEIAPAAAHGFYSYEAKYIDADGAVLFVPAQLEVGTTIALQEMAKRAFTALGCTGMARVDFFLRLDGHIFINEINTIPGFTNISMYPKVFAESGIPYPELIDRLIRHALKRAR